MGLGGVISRDRGCLKPSLGKRNQQGERSRVWPAGVGTWLLSLGKEEAEGSLWEERTPGRVSPAPCPAHSLYWGAGAGDAAKGLRQGLSAAGCSSQTQSPEQQQGWQQLLLELLQSQPCCLEGSVLDSSVLRCFTSENCFCSGVFPFWSTFPARAAFSIYCTFEFVQFWNVDCFF